jgi:hypothetical protein
MTTMQLIPTQLHGNVAHESGASAAKKNSP